MPRASLVWRSGIRDGGVGDARAGATPAGAGATPARAEEQLRLWDPTDSTNRLIDSTLATTHDYLPEQKL